MHGEIDMTFFKGFVFLYGMFQQGYADQSYDQVSFWLMLTNPSDGVNGYNLS